MNPIPVVAAVILDENNRVLIAQRKQSDAQGGLWEFPGGKLRASESPEECLIREIREELGLSISVEKIFAAVNYQYPQKTILLLAYLCKVVNGALELKEHQDAHWVRFSHLREYEFSPADIPIVNKLLEGKFNE